MEGLYVLLSPP